MANENNHYAGLARIDRTLAYISRKLKRLRSELEAELMNGALYPPQRDQVRLLVAVRRKLLSRVKSN